MNSGVIILLLFLFLLVMKVPVAFCMLLSALYYVFFVTGLPATFIVQTMVSGSSSYLILAAPFFILVGDLMNTGGITKRIFRFADALVGHISGGLGHVNIIASILFAGVSGSAIADAAGLGNVEIKAMTERGYDADFAVGITAASSTIGPIFPPSGPMVFYGILAGVSIGSLFLGGIVVGVLMAAFMMVTVFVISRKRNYPVRARASLSELWSAFKEAFWALLTPVFLIGGILSGIATPTEVAAVAVVYALIVGVFIHKELNLRALKEVFRSSITNIGMVMLLIAAGTLFSWMLGDQRVAVHVSRALFSITSNPILIILFINLFLLFIGTFMETVAGLILTIPLLLPIALEVGMSPVQFGVILVLNLMIGLLTPPMAICLFVTARIGGISFDRAVRAVAPYYVALILVVILINVFPVLTLGLPRLVFG